MKVNEWHAGYSATHNYTASALPESSLSRRIERRIRRRIHSEAILEGGTYSREEASDFLSIITALFNIANLISSSNFVFSLLIEQSLKLFGLLVTLLIIRLKIVSVHY